MTQQHPDGVIYDIGYRHYDGPRLGEGYIVRSLFLEGLRGAFGLGRAARTKIVPLLLLVAMCLPAVILATILNISAGDSLPVAYTSYYFVLFPLVSLFVASQAPTLASRDLRYRVMSLYLSRPLSRIGYVSAKFLALTCAVFVLVALPLAILFVGALLGGLPFWDQLREVAQGLGGVLLLSLLLAGIGLLIASITPRRGLGVAAIIAVLIVLVPVSGILQGLGSYSHNTVLEGYAGLTNPFALVDGVQTWLFGVEPNTGVTPPGSLGGPVYLLVALAVIAGTFALLNLRYRRVSVS